MRAFMDFEQAIAYELAATGKRTTASRRMSC